MTANKLIREEQICQTLIVMSDEGEFEIEGIVNFKREGRKKLYLIKWKGFPDSDNTWEPESSIPVDLLRHFQQQQ